MNEINYFSKQKLILFFRAWLTQDLSSESHLKTQPIVPPPLGLLELFPSWVTHFYLPCFILRRSLQLYFMSECSPQVTQKKVWQESSCLWRTCGKCPHAGFWKSVHAANLPNSHWVTLILLPSSEVSQSNVFLVLCAVTYMGLLTSEPATVSRKMGNSSSQETLKLHKEEAP